MYIDIHSNAPVLYAVIFYLLIFYFYLILLNLAYLILF